jgi:arginyl-tRNA synthetase
MNSWQLKEKINSIVAREFGEGLDVSRIDVSRTAEVKFGDFATNAAMVFAKELKMPPRQIADQLIPLLKETMPELASIEVAGPGFINMTLTDEAIFNASKLAVSYRPDTYAGKQVVAEYSDPSSFKVLHAGHLYTSVVGDAVANLLEMAGGDVHRVNFGGDVGLHVAKTMWAILLKLGGEYPERLELVDSSERAEWMSMRYVEGNNAYEENESIKTQMADLNKRVYQLFEKSDHDTPFAQIYWTCRKWSYDYFAQFYARIGSYFEKYYPESETGPVGLSTVREQLEKGVYKRSQGAVVFEGEPYGLHTRVFINSQGLPTYEAKDVGLIMMKWDDYHFDKSIVLTDSAQEEYMAVVLKSIEQYAPKLSKATTHITHGRVKLAGGQKMSSRKGNIVRAVDVLDLAAKANQLASGRDDPVVVLGAVKYAFLKQRLGSDVIYTPEESVSLDGNSGPYLQYAHARARSILRKSKHEIGSKQNQLSEGERILASKISQFPDVIEKSVNELMPHTVCTYLYEAAQVFNRFYETNRVIGDEREGVRIELVNLYADILKTGLAILGIEAPDQL